MEQNGPIPQMRESLRVVGETLLVAEIESVKIRRYQEWQVDNGWRLEIEAIGQKTRMRFVYERYMLGDPWRLISMESEPER